MDIATTIQKMTEFVATTKDDKLANAVSKVANRLINQGQPFEKELSAREIKIVTMFMGE